MTTLRVASIAVGQLTIVLAATRPCAAADLDWVRISADGREFVLASSGQRFVPWGFNYDHDALTGGWLELFQAQSPQSK